MSDSGDCIFCKIVAGDIPCSKVYEDDHVLAFLDIGPLAPGHTLVIPKRHAGLVTELSADESATLFRQV
ncbi:MAG: HIT family protein, partial [Planctomycetota bacterium]